MSELHLHVGRHCTGISLRPDGRYAQMWRVHWPDGWISPMGNITRAKDAALSALASIRGRGLTRGDVHRWHIRGNAPRRAPAAVLELAAT